MTDADTNRCLEHVGAARAALFDADLALALKRDPLDALVQVDMANARLMACIKIIQERQLPKR